MIRISSLTISATNNAEGLEIRKNEEKVFFRANFGEKHHHPEMTAKICDVKRFLKRTGQSLICIEAPGTPKDQHHTRIGIFLHPKDKAASRAYFPTSGDDSCDLIVLRRREFKSALKLLTFPGQFSK